MTRCCLKKRVQCLMLGLLAFSCQQQAQAQVSSTPAVVASEIPGRVTGDSRSGLIIRLLWFETREQNRNGVIEQLNLPVGAPYGSQEIRKIMPLGKGDLREDKSNNRFFIYKTPLTVAVHRPILIGYLAEVTQYQNAYITLPTRGLPEKLHDQETFLKNENEYDLNNPLVLKIARELKEGNPTPEALMRRVWNYINNHLTYAGVRRPNTGAEVLQWGKGLCGEYARASTTLLRACGIPSREVHSVYCMPEGLSTGDHGWSEAYLPEMGWVPLLVSARIPEQSAYVYTSWDRYITYRGLSVWNVQKFSATNVNKIGRFGMGRFVSMSAADCTRTFNFMERLIADDGRNASQLLSEVSSLPKDMHHLLFWLLAASENEEVGRSAAVKLHRGLESVANGASEWKTYINSCPKVAGRRLSLAVGSASDGSGLIKVDSASRTGALLGSFKKGQTITLQYVEGVWTLGTDNPQAWPERSPDDYGTVHRFYRTALRLYDTRKNESIKLIPGGTKTTRFSYTLNDDCDIWIACNDAVVGNNVKNNRGTATYRFAVN